jgi:photosystem II stability/assembly factor-like uncharacterized protein
MRRVFVGLSTVVFLAGFAAVAEHVFRSAPLDKPKQGGGPYPSDWFGLQRAFPLGEIPQGAYREAIERARVDRAAAQLSTSGLPMTWTLAGPTNIGGRVTAIAGHASGFPVYLGSADGGVWRSDDFGLNWYPIFDEVGVPSIGSLAVDPNNANILYVGTGEANSSLDSYDGDGLYKTSDGGATWERLGLETVGRIARVAVDPSNPARIYVAAMGKQFSTGPDRGFYRTTDGGQTWSKTLFVNDSTGVCEVVVNPAHPETMFCATWERVRRATYRRAFGPGCGIWRSTNFGSSWTRLAGGLPTPSDSVGRIGLAIARSRPSTIYAQIIAGTIGSYQGRGLYRSDNGGVSWGRRDVSGFATNFGGFGWYFGDVVVHPSNPERVWSLGVPLIRSNNGGISFSSTSYGHVDQHAMFIAPSDTSKLLIGNDGGIWRSLDSGNTIGFPVSLPITQFYAGAIDPSNPNRLLGGTQDNNTLITNDGDPGGWTPILGGDGFQCIVDPTNPNVIIAEWQYCCDRSGPRRSTTGGASFMTPLGITTSDRFNWNTPLVMDPSNHNLILCGSQRVYRSTDNGISYTPISGDLTTNSPAQVVYGTITTLDISPLSNITYFAGTDDGRVWRSTDAGGAWTDISAGLPTRYVTRVVADPVSPTTVYVTLSGFVLGEGESHLYRSTNLGNTWTALDAELPNSPVNDVVVAPWDPQTLFAATDVGVYATRNLGATWYPLGQGLPLQAINDLNLHAPSRTLVAATHGRSQWKLDLNQMPLAVDTRPAAPVLALGAPRPNPTSSTIHATLEVPAATTLEIEIYDAMGRRAAQLHRGPLAAGRHDFAWDGRDAAGRRLPGGAYFMRATSASGSVTRRFIRLD